MRSVLRAVAIASVLWLLLVLLLCIGGCRKAPTAPDTPTATHTIEEVSAPVKPAWPQHHNIPAVAPDGSVWWLCETQPREYVKSDGKHEWTLDHYVQRDSCPDVPIR